MPKVFQLEYGESAGCLRGEKELISSSGGGGGGGVAGDGNGNQAGKKKKSVKQLKIKTPLFHFLPLFFLLLLQVPFRFFLYLKSTFLSFCFVLLYIFPSN